jgi:hypothetical protein
MVVVLCVMYWWRAGGRETIMQCMRPRFHVLAIDVGAGTMVLRQWNRTYTVKCEHRCDEFAAGKSYSANDRGSDLEIKVAKHVVRCPIIKIEVRFETHPGGLGNYMSLGGQLAGQKIRPKTQRARVVLDVGSEWQRHAPY